MTFYIGVDFHPHQQTFCWCDNQTGETKTFDLDHDLKKVKEFYSTLPEPVVVGIEATGRATWFEKMIAETGHKLVVGNLDTLSVIFVRRCVYSIPFLKRFRGNIQVRSLRG